MAPDHTVIIDESDDDADFFHSAFLLLNLLSALTPTITPLCSECLSCRIWKILPSKGERTISAVDSEEGQVP